MENVDLIINILTGIGVVAALTALGLLVHVARNQDKNAASQVEGRADQEKLNPENKSPPEGSAFNEHESGESVSQESPALNSPKVRAESSQQRQILSSQRRAAQLARESAKQKRLLSKQLRMQKELQRDIAKAQTNVRRAMSSAQWQANLNEMIAKLSQATVEAQRAAVAESYRNLHEAFSEYRGNFIWIDPTAGVEESKLTQKDIDKLLNQVDHDQQTA